MQVRQLWLQDFRCYESLALELPAGFTVVVGSNGQGKTSLLEAISWTASTCSFRGVPDAALVRDGASSAVVRVDIAHDERSLLVEAEIRTAGRNRIQINRQVCQRARDLLGALRVTVFSPDDLELVKGGPAFRRKYLDDLLVAIAPRYEAARSDYERVLRHRNILLRNGVRDAEAQSTIEVFDEQLIAAGSEIIRGRLRLIDRLLPAIRHAYETLAGEPAGFDATYVAEWSPQMILHETAEACFREGLTKVRVREIDRGVTLAGPHRDDWSLLLHGRESRTHASQGEQRTLSLALRLAGHAVCTEVTGEAPVLLLDDVFSELDPKRSATLLEHLPPGQTLLTTAGAVPPQVRPDQHLRVEGGKIMDLVS